MTDLDLNAPCLIFPMHRESQAFRREFRPHQRFAGAPCWARFCGPAWLSVLVVHAGVGQQRMQETLTWLLQPPMLENLPYRPKVILLAGFAGALQTGLSGGDVILADTIVDTLGQRWPVPWPGPTLPSDWRFPLKRGRVLTATRLIGKPEDKHALGKEFDALAVDMESSTFAQRCHDADIPFGCVRVISDDADTALSPRLVSLLSSGRVSPLRLAVSSLVAPSLLPQLWGLAKKTRLAGEQLGKALGELLTLTLSWSEDLEQE